MKTLGFYLTTFLIVFVLGSANAGARTIEMLNKDELEQDGCSEELPASRLVDDYMASYF